MPLFSSHTGIRRFWLVSLLVLLLCLVAFGHAFLLMVSTSFEVHHDPLVKSAFENWFDHHLPGSFDALNAAEQDAVDRLSPPEWLRAVYFLLAASLTSSFLIIELITFGVMLGKRGIEDNYRMFIAVVLSIVVGVLGLVTGASGMAVLSSSIENSIEVQQAIRANDQEQDRAVAAKRKRDAQQFVEERAEPLANVARFILIVSIAVLFHGGIAYTVNFTVLLYKLWQTVQDGAARTTPRNAVACLFLPLFNLYWVFVALPGLADELNRCSVRQSLSLPSVNRRWMVAYCLLAFVACIPFL